MIIDTHTHLDLEQYDEDREQVIQRALENDVASIITIGTDLKSSELSIKLAEKYAPVFAAVGIHPTDCQDTAAKDFQIIEEMLEHEKVIAVGEIGLDYYHMRAERDKQINTFSTQIELAIQSDRPVIIHNREAHEDLINLIAKSNLDHLDGVLHSFSGDMKYLENILKTDFHISFTGNITFKNTQNLDLVQRTPLEKLLLETDSPFLTPVPLRGRRNEPAYVKYTAQKIAEIKQIPLEEVLSVTSENAVKLFNLPL